LASCETNATRAAPAPAAAMKQLLQDQERVHAGAGTRALPSLPLSLSTSRSTALGAHEKLPAELKPCKKTRHGV
jgi:hypothetical protein